MNDNRNHIGSNWTGRAPRTSSEAFGAYDKLPKWDRPTKRFDKAVEVFAWLVGVLWVVQILAIIFRWGG